MNTPDPSSPLHLRQRPHRSPDPDSISVALGSTGTATTRATEILLAEHFRVAPWVDSQPATPELLILEPSSSVSSSVVRLATESRVPVLLIGDADQPAGVNVRKDATDSIPITFRPDELLHTVYSLLARRGHLALLARRFDEDASQLTRTDDVEWARCRTGITGLIRIELPGPIDELKARLALRVAIAHSALDELSETSFTADDLWNLLLLVSLPWNQAEAARDDHLMSVLTALELDLTGSRKLCLWRGVSPLSHLGGFAARADTWLPGTTNPLGDELRRLSKDSVEHEALLAIFKRRLLESDVERIIDVLKRGQDR